MTLTDSLKRLAVLLLVLFSASAVSAAPGVGDAAPDFTMAASDGNTYTLADLRGQYVVIAFFPKAFTGG